LGRYFDPKVRCAFDLGLIDARVRESIVLLHHFRNTSYHQGKRHDRILHSLAVFYFRLSCDLLLKYESSIVWESGDTISYRAKKYLGAKPNDPREELKQAFSRLGELADDTPESLIVDLVEDMSETIDETDHAIHFLATEAPKKQSRQAAIIDCQLWSSIFSDEAKAFARDNKCDTSTMGEYVEWLTANYPWPVRSSGYVYRFRDSTAVVSRQMLRPPFG
jgi:hypothetical protein